MISFRASSENKSLSSSSNTCSKPTGVQEGDLMIASVVTENQGDTITAPTGWKDCGEGKQASGYHAAQSFYKIAGASEPASYQFNFSGTGDNTVIISAYEGVDNKTPIAHCQSEVDTSFTTSHTPADVLAPTSGCWVVLCQSAEGAAGGITPPTGYTEREEINSAYNAICDTNGTVSEGTVSPGDWSTDQGKQSVCFTLSITPSKDDAFVQKISGSVSFSLSETTKEVSLSTIDINKSVIFITSRHSEAEPRRIWGGYLEIDGTTVKAKFERETSSPGGGTFYYEVWEFEGSGMRVQRGTETVTLATDSVTIDTVDRAHAFPIVNWREGNESWKDTKGWHRAKLTADTTLTFYTRAAPSSTTKAFWQVIETEFADVQEVDLSLGSSDTSDTGSITSVTTSKTFLIGSVSQDTNGTYNDYSEEAIRLTLNSATQIEAHRDSTGAELTVTVYVIEINSNLDVIVQHGSVSMSSASTQEDETISSITTANSVCLFPTGDYSQFGGSIDSTGTDQGAFTCRYEFTSTTNLRVNRAATNSDAAEFSYFVLDFSPPPDNIVPPKWLHFRQSRM